MLVFFKNNEAILDVKVFTPNLIVVSDDHYYLAPTRKLWDFLEELKKKMRIKEKKIVIKGKLRFVEVEA